VIFEDFAERPPGKLTPQCMAGAGACPPEDCGGSHGYQNLLEALADPSHPEHENLSDWVAGPIDPENFDVAEVHFDDPKARWRIAFEGGAI